MERICDNCRKLMRNSLNTEIDTGELEVFVHVKCINEWADKQIKLLRDYEITQERKK